MALVCRIGSAQGLRSVNGELRYEYQYQDFSNGVNHTTASTQSPMLNLGTSGSLINPAILSFDLHTNLNLSSTNSQFADNTLSTKSFSWNYYDLGLSLLRNLPVSTSLRLTDGITQTSSSTPQYDREGNHMRKQDQVLRMMTQEIPYLPSTSFSIFRTHQWSLNPAIPLDQLGTSYALSLSSGGKGGSVSVSGSYSESSERYTGLTTRFYNVLLHGMRNLADLQSLNYDINYNRYADATNINAMASYNNATDKQLHYTTTLSSHNNSGPTYQSLLSSISQSVQYIQNDNFRYSLGMTGNLGRNEYTINNGSNADNIGASGSFSIQHNRGYKSIGISNGLSFGYGYTKYLDHQSTFSTSFSNGLTAPLGPYQLAFAHSISYGQLNDNINRKWVNNSASLNVSGTAFNKYLMQINTSYESEINSGDLEGYGNSRQIQTQWFINSPMYYFTNFQFNVGLSGGESWYYGNREGQLSTWSGNFSCTQSYIRNLTFAYSFVRSYNPIYNEQSTAHSVDIGYRWRAIAMQVRYENYQLDNNRNNFWFMVSRPF